VTPLSAKVGINFADKQRSLGRYSSLADSGHGVFFMFTHKNSLLCRAINKSLFPEGRVKLGNLVADGRIILKFTLEKCDVKALSVLA
jgi:hypothetical protein